MKKEKDQIVITPAVRKDPSVRHLKKKIDLTHIIKRNQQLENKIHRHEIEEHERQLRQ